MIQFLNKKIQLGLISSFFVFNVSANAFTVVDPAQIAGNVINTTTNVTSGVANTASTNAWLTAENILNGAREFWSGQVSMNMQKYYEQTMDSNKHLGGGYAGTAMDVFSQCFGNLNLPNINLGWSMPNLDFCGADTILGLVDQEVRNRASTINSENQGDIKNNKFKFGGNSKEVKHSTKKSDGSRVNCNEQLSESCRLEQVQQYNQALKNGVGKTGEVETASLKAASRKVNAMDNTNKKISDKDKQDGKGICVNNEANTGTTEAMACLRSVANTLNEQQDMRQSIGTGTSNLDVSKKSVARKNMLDTNEKLAEDITRGVNTLRDMRDDYNIRYSPTTMFKQDKELMKGLSFVDLNKDYLKIDPTLYLLPILSDGKGANKNKSVNFNLYSLDTYEQAINDISNIKNKPGSTLKAQEVFDRVGGITPFSSSIIAYESTNEVIADSMYGDADGEKGDLGRDIAKLNGLKGVMLQLVLLNQQMENQTRADYNVRIKEFEKMSSDNDKLNNKLEQIQNQNAIIINVLEDIATSLKVISRK